MNPNFDIVDHPAVSNALTRLTFATGEPLSWGHLAFWRLTLMTQPPSGYTDFRYGVFKVAAEHDAIVKQLYDPIAARVPTRDVQWLVDDWALGNRLPDKAEAWIKLMAGGCPQNADETRLMAALEETIATRRLRWEELAARANIEVPSSFELYRAVDGQDCVRRVLQAWGYGQDPKVPARALSSWSLDPGWTDRWCFRPVVSFRLPLPKPAHEPVARVWGAKFRLVVDFEDTVIDKFVDDHNLLKIFGRQSEVVVASGTHDFFSVHPFDAIVWIGSEVFGYDDRDRAFEVYQHWRTPPADPSSDPLALDLPD